MAKLYNLAAMTTATVGTGTLTLGSPLPGFLSFETAGIQNGDIVTYSIRDGAHSEIGRGTYTASGTTLTRSVLKSTNGNAPIELTGAAEVRITAAAEDILSESTAAGRALLMAPDAPAQRIELGLGSLATVTAPGTPTGTKYLRDDEVWAVPAGGGGGGGSSGPDTRVLSMLIAELKAGRINVHNGIVDPFATTDDVDVAGATNLDSSTPGKLMPTTTSGSNVRVTGGTPSMPHGGTAANINDNNPATTATTNGLGNLTSSPVADRIFALIDYGSNKQITRIEAKQLSMSSSGPTDLTFHYSVDGTSWTQFGSSVSCSTTPTDRHQDGAAVTARYIAIAAMATAYTSITHTIGDLNGYEYVPGSPNNLVVRSEAFALPFEPSSATLVLQLTPVDSITINTNVIGKVSRDDGTTWATATLAAETTLADGSTLYVAEGIDVSGQPAGQDLRWRVESVGVLFDYGGVQLVGAA